MSVAAGRVAIMGQSRTRTVSTKKENGLEPFSFYNTPATAVRKLFGGFLGRSSGSSLATTVGSSFSSFIRLGRSGLFDRRFLRRLLFAGNHAEREQTDDYQCKYLTHDLSSSFVFTLSSRLPPFADSTTLHQNPSGAEPSAPATHPHTQDSAALPGNITSFFYLLTKQHYPNSCYSVVNTKKLTPRKSGKGGKAEKKNALFG